MSLAVAGIALTIPRPVDWLDGDCRAQKILRGTSFGNPFPTNEGAEGVRRSGPLPFTRLALRYSTYFGGTGRTTDHRWHIALAAHSFALAHCAV